MQQTYYLLRHGKAIPDEQEYGGQILTASLLPEGEEQIKKIATFLQQIPPTDNFSSEMLRCRQSAEIVTQMTGKHFIFDKRLNEYHNESFDHLRSRVKHFLDTVQHKKNVLLCTHAAVIAAIKHLLTEGTFFEKDQLDYTQTGELMIIKSKQIEIKQFH